VPPDITCPPAAAPPASFYLLPPTTYCGHKELCSSAYGRVATILVGGVNRKAASIKGPYRTLNTVMPPNTWLTPGVNQVCGGITRRPVFTRPLCVWPRDKVSTSLMWRPHISGHVNTGLDSHAAAIISARRSLHNYVVADITGGGV